MTPHDLAEIEAELKSARYWDNSFCGRNDRVLNWVRNHADTLIRELQAAQERISELERENGEMRNGGCRGIFRSDSCPRERGPR